MFNNHLILFWLPKGMFLYIWTPFNWDKIHVDFAGSVFPKWCAISIFNFLKSSLFLEMFSWIFKTNLSCLISRFLLWAFQSCIRWIPFIYPSCHFLSNFKLLWFTFYFSCFTSISTSVLVFLMLFILSYFFQFYLHFNILFLLFWALQFTFCFL